MAAPEERSIRNMNSIPKFPLVSLISVLLTVLNGVSTQSTSSSEFRCQNGQISVTPCRRALFGSPRCDNNTLVCEQKQFCCPSASSTTKPVTGSTSSGIPVTGTTVSPPENSDCEKCDIVARHSCFLSLHVNYTTTETPNRDCAVCENCCNDAFPHKCEVWKNHDFCDMEWYSSDKKRILCGKTCGIC